MQISPCTTPCSFAAHLHALGSAFYHHLRHGRPPKRSMAHIDQVWFEQTTSPEHVARHQRRRQGESHASPPQHEITCVSCEGSTLPLSYGSNWTAWIGFNWWAIFSEAIDVHLHWIGPEAGVGRRVLYCHGRKLGSTHTMAPRQEGFDLHHARDEVT